MMLSTPGKENLPAPEQPNLLHTAGDLGFDFFRQLPTEAQEELGITVHTGKSLLFPDADVTDVHFSGGGISFIHGPDIQTVTVTVNGHDEASLANSRQNATELTGALQTFSNQ